MRHTIKIHLQRWYFWWYVAYGKRPVRVLACESKDFFVPALGTRYELFQKNSNDRNSILLRARASTGDHGLSNTVCAVRRVISSPAES
jgi:hypothetical protein